MTGTERSSAAAVRVVDLAFRYPDGSEGLRGLDLEVAAGDHVAILGPNGAGKSTLLLHLIGIHRARRGRVEIGGTTLTDATVGDLRRRVGLVFSDPDDQLFMPTVREDVGFGPANLGLRGDDLAARVAEALDAVGCGHLAGRAPHHLSGGERRRIAVATVLAMRPEVLALDEPTAGLDPASRRELIEILRGLPGTLLTVTHDLSYALEVCPRTVIVDGGTVVADGPTADVLADGELLAAHRLELPFGMDPRTVAPPATA